MKKRLIYLFLFIVLILFFISACEQYVGRNVNRNINIRLDENNPNINNANPIKYETERNSLLSDFEKYNPKNPDKKTEYAFSGLENYEKFIKVIENEDNILYPDSYENTPARDQPREDLENRRSVNVHIIPSRNYR